MDGRIFHLKKLLLERLGHHWTVDEMAKVVDLSTTHFQKIFKTQVGVPPKVFLHDARLEKARELLETTFLQIKQIGFQTGLKNDSHFTRDFKKKFGSSPTQYRENYWEIKQSATPKGKRQ